MTFLNLIFSFDPTPHTPLRTGPCHRRRPLTCARAVGVVPVQGRLADVVLGAAGRAQADGAGRRRLVLLVVRGTIGPLRAAV